MSWIEKTQHTSLDNLPIDGLYYLSGDLLVRLFAGEHPLPFFDPEWIKGQKLAQVQFPSGESFDIEETISAETSGIVHVFGEMDLPYFSTRDEAWTVANSIAEQVGYVAILQGADGIEVRGHDLDDHYLITYEDVERRIRDIVRIKA